MADAAADVEAHAGGGATQTAKDLFAGATGGIAQVLLGECIHSLDERYVQGHHQTSPDKCPRRRGRAGAEETLPES